MQKSISSLGSAGFPGACGAQPRKSSKNAHPRLQLMTGSGQGRDRFGLFGEARIRIPKPTWRAWGREKTGRPAIDPNPISSVVFPLFLERSAWFLPRCSGPNIWRPVSNAAGLR